VRLLVATRSVGKRRELWPLLEAYGVSPIDLDAAGVVEMAHEAEVECHETFEGNALAKGRYFYGVSGLATLAEDSGLCVLALGGRPGVRSRRWSGRADLSGPALDEANNAQLLAELAGAGDRRASYVCVAVVVDEDGEVIGRGETRGTILEAPRGTGGFGYDPLFCSGELGRSFAEVSQEAKGEVSHRARAVSAVLAGLRGRR